jgi:glucose-1-phosphate cytidylyltransferase
MAAVQPEGRFGAIVLHEGQTTVDAFREKPAGDGAWVNGGFFVLEPTVIDHIDGDDVSWEHEPLRRLAHEGQLAAFQHHGFWQPMDTLRDRQVLEQMWATGEAPWKAW